MLIRQLYGKPEIPEQEIFDYLMRCKEIVTPYVANTFEFLQKAVREDKNILLEGQLGSLKDTDFGIYPMVTSSSTLAGYGAVGAGIPARAISEVITVTKAYSSAVGAGEFVSEIFGDEAEELRRRGGDRGEFGATTGRPRRVGWFDCVATRYGCMAQGTTKVAMTCLENSPSPTFLPRPSRFFRRFPAGNATSGALPPTTSCPKTAAITSNLSRDRSASRLTSFPTAPAEKRLFTDNNAKKRALLPSGREALFFVKAAIPCVIGFWQNVAGKRTAASDSVLM